ncbi:hypothetical protein PR001_g5711 [Phytophthora rubi]|uniref:Uncharacterized protein n=1 Tax=Phytophthora rubi TaxID=129364 RepID=A0A6A3NDU7_9STRA|nr:hypothetical protein PR001_g5711 [Phytophthora rubi]
MGAKLLEWGGTLFLLRLELGQLQVHRIDVDAEEKKASLIHCTLKSDEEAAALLVDARLVAAKEVEDTTVATRYPVLVFQASTASSAAASRKRRRSTDEEEVNAADGEAVPNQSRRLIFFLLYETETDGEMGLRFLNELGVPTSTGGNGGDLAIDDSLQVFLADGPYVLLFERGSRMATVLKLQRAKEGGGFCVWREQVDVVGRTRGDTSVPTEVVSCAYVSDVYCTRPHLLIHFQRQPTDREIHTCGVLSKLEQITCCCFISELNEWDFTASPSSAATSFTSWDQDAVSRATITDTSVSTLVVTGTSSNTIYVHTNGILLASYVLPTQPAEMWCMCDESTSKRFVLGIRCNDVNRSFFILGFSSSPENATFELLLSFNHVGHAYVGDFTRGHASNYPSTDQVLLLNNLPGITGAHSCSIGENMASEERLDDEHLVKRSVLVTQKVTMREVKLSCHRLRLREGKKVKHGSRSRKRSRNDEKESSKGDLAGSKPQSFLYIERTQKASPRDRSVVHPDGSTGDVESVSTASHAQLAKLVDSLSTRLGNGLKELERLQMIVNDKCSVAHQLNQLIIRKWRQQQQTAHPKFPSAATVFGSAAVQPAKVRFQLELQFGPSFTFLRMRKPLEATLWLHWGASHDAPRSATTSSEWQPSLFAIAVAAVKIYPEELLRGTSTMKPTSRNLSPQHEHEQLLFISAGSSLTSWLGNQSHGLTNSAAAIVRPKFALVNLNVTIRELMLYEMSQMVANLPSDVYVMHNPFQRQHLSALQRILHAIRQEILADQQRDSAREKKVKKVGENGARMKTLKAERNDPASSRRAIQQDTDLQVNELLLMLQKRMNFHTMWFDSAAKDSVED